jgi:hypothetical protein
MNRCDIRPFGEPAQEEAFALRVMSQSIDNPCRPMGKSGSMTDWRKDVVDGVRRRANLILQVGSRDKRELMRGARMPR